MGSYKLISAEDWLSSNMSRNYPLSDDMRQSSAGGAVLPDSFLADLGLYILPGTDSGVSTRFYVDRVYPISEGSLAMDLGYSPDDGEEAFVFAHVTGIPLSLQSGDSVADRTFDIVPDMPSIPDDYDGLKYAAGTVVIGTCDDMSGMEYVLGPDSGRILPTCIITATAGVTGILVGTELMAGTIVLEAGDGIELSTSKDESGTSTIHIKRVPTEEERNSKFQSVADVKKEIENTFGRAIRTINGIEPDSAGNFRITGDDCTSIEPSQNGITLTNPCAKPCCPDVESDDVTQALSGLEAAQDRLEAYFTELSGKIGEMQSRLASAISSR